ncbi:hypothetical protein N7516_001587 [Penicillium verrucosum]|uniref:uncharacterized protein n=1 Tax=Penicillium verrucosum TaxID=60171 RepID=UPI002545748B|nr:uncharacterized protein N7516_001587 [Penicillium verrucosum]KAJ5941419.1 hypothetical protein N7516_001587 [Penicillium verrucosum]
MASLLLYLDINLYKGFKDYDFMVLTGKENKILRLTNAENEEPRGGGEENIARGESSIDINIEEYVGE